MSRKRSGSAKPGYPLVEHLTLHNGDGSTSEIGVQTSEVTKSVLEKELFEVPAGYGEVKTVAELNGPAPQAGTQAGSSHEVYGLVVDLKVNGF